MYVNYDGGDFTDNNDNNDLGELEYMMTITDYDMTTV